MPSLFGANDVSSKVLPPGYHLKKQPDSNAKCDSIHCTVTVHGSQWLLFRGCWHSFHTVCLKNMAVCPRCKEHLPAEIERLAAVASSGIIHQGSPDDQHSDGDDDGDPEESPPTSDRINVEMEKQRLNRVISELTPPREPELENCAQHVHAAKKPPHCRQCGHATRGHATGVGGRTCPQCPSGKCSKGSQVPCTCP